jgi:hypothetical protein
MKTFGIDDSGAYEGDLSVVNNAFVMLENTETVKEATKQLLRSRLRTFLGEWFLDITEGTPYFEDIFKKNPDFAIVLEAFKTRILGTDGIDSIDSYEMDFLDNRVLSLEFTVAAGDDTITESIIIEV